MMSTKKTLSSNSLVSEKSRAVASFGTSEVSAKGELMPLISFPMGENVAIGGLKIIETNLLLNTVSATLPLHPPRLPPRRRMR